jgi:hypothetical protein
MSPQTFPCPYCQQLIGVAPEHAGLPVSCPHCRQVVMAPPAEVAKVEVPTPAAIVPANAPSSNGWSSVDRKADELKAAHQQAVERADSIFGEVAEEGLDDEALFGSGPKKSPLPQDELAPVLTRPTQRVPGLADVVTAAPPAPAQAKALLEPIFEESDNPFTPVTVTTPTPRNETPAVRRSKPKVQAKAIAEPKMLDWKLWVIIGLAGYSLLMTVIAIWGWARSPAPTTTTPAPTTAKAKAK